MYLDPKNKQNEGPKPRNVANNAIIANTFGVQVDIVHRVGAAA